MLGKEQFIRGLAEAQEISIKQATEETNRVFGHLVDLAEQGESVNIRGVLKMTVSEVEARKGRNPQTGEEIDLPATRKVKLSAMKALKSAVKGE